MEKTHIALPIIVKVGANSLEWLLKPEETFFCSALNKEQVPFTKTAIYEEVCHWKECFEEAPLSDEMNDLYKVILEHSDMIQTFICYCAPDENNALRLLGVATLAFSPNPPVHVALLNAFLVHPCHRQKMIGSRMVRSIKYFFAVVLPEFSRDLNFGQIVLVTGTHAHPFWVQNMFLPPIPFHEASDLEKGMLGLMFLSSLAQQCRMMCFMLKQVCHNQQCSVLHHSKDLKRCGPCRNTRYCSPECQKQDWPRHKVNCRHKN